MREDKRHPFVTRVMESAIGSTSSFTLSDPQFMVSIYVVPGAQLMIHANLFVPSEEGDYNTQCGIMMKEPSREKLMKALSKVSAYVLPATSPARDIIIKRVVEHFSRLLGEEQ